MFIKIENEEKSMRNQDSRESYFYISKYFCKSYHNVQVFNAQNIVRQAKNNSAEMFKM